MRSPVDLVDLPHTFSQRSLSTAEEVCSEARRRGYFLTERHLEHLHRLRLFVPLLRYRRDGRQIVTQMRSDRHHARRLAHWRPCTRRELQQARDDGRLFDPQDESFSARHREVRKRAGLTYRPSEYLYAWPQLAFLEHAWRVTRHVRDDGTHELAPHWLEAERERAQQRRAEVVAGLALEGRHYPSVVEVTRAPEGRDWDAYDQWRRESEPAEVLRWLGVDADWLVQRAGEILRSADEIDPLGGWIDLAQHARPKAWEKLRTAARSAVEIRVLAEVLLRHHETLVAAGVAEPPRERRRFEHDPLRTRLRPQERLDAVLGEFGLSPHPRVVLVVEGHTEELLVPRVMEHFGVSLDRSLISIVNAQGIGSNLTALAAFVGAPDVRYEERDGSLELLRPPTRLLVVTDAEGPMETPELREAKRAYWVERLLGTLPRHARTPAVQESLSELVHIETWRDDGESFEFAHFTDEELAEGIAACWKQQYASQVTSEQVLSHVAGTRARRGNLSKEGVHRLSKVRLAEELWPTLKRKIETAGDGAVDVPIVRVLARALDLAHQYGRHATWVIPLEGVEPDGLDVRASRR